MSCWAKLLLVMLLQASMANAATPVAVLGTWEPHSRAFEGDGPIIVGVSTITWSGCKNIPYKIMSDEVRKSYPGESPAYNNMFRVITLHLVQDDSCGNPHVYLQFALPAEYPGTEAITIPVIMYESPEKFKNGAGDGYHAFGAFYRSAQHK